MSEKLGRYRLLKLIATGGMGEVFLARQEGPAGFAKTVVIKRILRHLARDQGFIDLFLNEARLAALLQHPHIAQVFGLEHEDGSWFIAMEYVHGRSLRDVLEAARKKGLKVPVRIAARLASQALQGLHFAHELTDARGRPLGILHRDVSPENLLVSFAGALKLVDFGIAKAVRAEEAKVGRPKGKLAYMAPEATVAGGTVDRRADVYAVGVVLYEVLTLQLPPNTPRTVAEAQAPREPYVAEPNLPGPINQVLARAMAEDPARRFADAQEMSDALEGYLVGTRQPVTPADVAEFLQALFGDEATAAVALEAGVTSTAVLPGGTQPLSLPHLSPVGGAVSAASLPSLAPVPGSTRPLSAPQLSPVAPSARELAPVNERRQLVLPVLVGAVTASLIFFLVLLAVWPRAPASTEEIPLVEAGPNDLQIPELEIPVEVETTVDPEPPEVTPAEPPGAPTEPTAVRRPPVRRPARTGRVTIRVNPWAEVSFGGRTLGTTPLPPVEVPAGTATFVLRNSQLGVTRRVSVKVPAGGSVVLKADLFKR
jgi:serine/threonine-protein kinase